MGEKEPLSDDSITHGMCEKCAEKMIREEEEEISDGK
jgi:hypothetical protein